MTSITNCCGKARRRSRRRAGVYVAVLGSAMMVTVIGLSALMLIRTERQAIAGTADMLQAKFYAQSAVEMGQYRIRADKDWRTSFPNGTWEADRPLGLGSYTLEGIDPVDSDLSDSLEDPLILTGIGRAAAARYKLQATFVPIIGPVGALGAAMHAGVDLALSGVTVTCAQKVSANRNVTASGSNVEAVETIGGGTYLLSCTTGVSAKSMPSSAVFDYYLSNGSAISYAGLPGSQGTKTIERVVISPSTNP